jgi:hypothetical protein
MEQRRTMSQQKNNNLFVMIAGAVVAVTGALILVILGMQGTLSTWGMTLGVLFGLWICFGYLIGRDIYQENRKHLTRLVIFMVVFLVLGYALNFGWQIPYFQAHSSERGKTFLEQIVGMPWALSLALHARRIAAIAAAATPIAISATRQLGKPWPGNSAADTPFKFLI